MRLARPLGGVLAAALVALATVVAAPAGATAPTPDGSSAWFGPEIDPGHDSLDAYAARLGADPSLVSVEVAYPLDDAAADVVREVAAAAARSGTVVVVDARPTVPLAELTPRDADDLARTLHVLERDRGSEFLVRFAPEMNGSWETWGQQPRDYVAAFRTVAGALHEDTDAGTVWAPVYGSGYPFRATDGADGALDLVLERDRPSLDTSGDGRLDAADDPYGPYFPGDGPVDWVGLSMYRLGQSQSLRSNAELPAAELRQRLRERWGYGDDGLARHPFTDRFATPDQPLLLGTAAPYNTEVGGDPELEVKRAWWRQLLRAVDADDRIGGATWLEVRRREPEVANLTVEWRATATPALARALRRDLRASDRIALGPVYEVRDRDADLVTPQPSGPAPGDDPTLDGRAASPAWWWLGSGVLLVLALVAGLLRPRAADLGAEDRDPRLDVVRGCVLVGSAVALVTTLGLGLGSLPAWLVVGGVGTLLVVSGCAHLLADDRLAGLGGGPAAVAGHLKRAVVLYLAALVLTLLHLLLDAVPGVVSPFGSYPDAAELLAYPPPGDVVADLLTLRIAPGPVVLFGLFACLAVLAAPVGAVLRRGAWWAVLAGSWLVFALGLRTGWHLDALGWEAGWPLLVWQVPFVHGMVATDQLLRQPRTGRRVALAATGVAGLGAASWGALVLVGLAPDGQPAMVVALLVAATALAATVLGWGLLGRPLGWAATAGRRPIAVTALLVLAVAGVSLV